MYIVQILWMEYSQALAVISVLVALIMTDNW